MKTNKLINKTPEQKEHNSIMQKCSQVGGGVTESASSYEVIAFLLNSIKQWCCYFITIRYVSDNLPTIQTPFFSLHGWAVMTYERSEAHQFKAF